MFNLNIPPSSLLGIDGTGGLSSTPKTPEIVNSLIAMTNPMDNYNFSTAINSSTASTPGSIVTVRNFNNAQNAQSISQDSSHSSCSASPLNSPAGTNTTPSVQQTCSQLIKAGLKLSIQSKRKLSTCDSSSGSEQPNSKCARRDEDCDETTDDDSENKSTAKGLTPEDEDRRRRRRERNKIAATKCRMKKRERTQNLIKESEQLDTQNIDLKTQVRALELERRKLLEMLQAHSPTCIRRGGFSLPSKLLQSPAFKYLAELNLDGNNCSGNSTPTGTPASGQQTEQQQQQLNGSVTTPQRTAIPPMSTIKFSRSNGFKAVAAAAAAAAVTAAASANGSIVTSSQQQQQQQQQQHLHQLPAQTSSPTLHHHHQQQLPNGYCKPSPTAQELGYLNSPSQDSICLASMQPQPHHQQQQQQQQQHAVQTPTAHQITTSSAADAVTVAIVNQQLNDYIPNCDNSLGLGLTSSHTHTPTCSTPTNSSGDNSVLLGGGLVSPMTPTTATEFVKNELVDSSSPYTTAQSAERFLFENNCDSFVDIKHAVSVHLGSSILSGNHHHNNNNNNNNNNSSHNNHNSNSIGGLSSLIHTNGISNIINNSNNNSNSLLDFHPSLMCNGVNGSGIVSFHDQISIKNDYLHEADLLAQLTGDAAEFVDLDTGVSAAFMTNGGCLA